MSDSEKINQLTQQRANALMRYYAAVQTKEQAERVISTTTAQLQALGVTPKPVEDDGSK